jgi:hypothetical protein
MKVSAIKKVLDQTLRLNEMGKQRTPLFIGDAGLGKSQVIQQWVKDQREKDPKFGYIDLRLSYLESPDMIGYPDKAQINGEWRQINALPDFWPTEGRGLLVLEEVNLAQPSVLNTLMQILTEKKCHNYVFPSGWIICAAVNPDTEHYNVTAMSKALMNRFSSYHIEYDKQTFIEHIKDTWDKNVVEFLKGSQWAYMAPDKLGKKDGKEDVYVSPRTWHKISDAELASMRDDRELHRITVIEELGADVGSLYHAFCFDESPVYASDILADEKEAFKKLKKQCQKGHYKGDLVSATVESLSTEFSGEVDKKNTVDWKLIFRVAEIIPADQAVNLIIKALSNPVNKTSIGDLQNVMPESLKALMKANLNAK